MREARITISGYYGFNNAGDEAVLAGLVKAFRSQRSERELQINALSMRPEETRDIHGIASAHRYRATELLRSLRHTDLLVSGGGSLLQDVTSAHGIFYYAGVVRAAQMLGKKTMFMAQGIGPLIHSRSRKLVASVANKLDAITVRDSGSAVLLREIGVKKPIEVTADPALLLTPSEIVRSQKGFAVALRHWANQESLPDTVARACFTAMGQTSAAAVAMQPQSDCATMDQFAGAWRSMTNGQAAIVVPNRPNSDIMDLNVALSCFAGCEMVVGMRLHALILAVACGVPCVALSYDPKVAAFMDSCGEGDAVYDLQENNPEHLTSLLQKIWRERAVRSESLQAQLPQLRAAAQRNADISLGLL